MQLFTDSKQATQYFVKLYGKKTLCQTNRYSLLFAQFKKHFKRDCCYLASSSGRVEVIGNHTDHNGGQVVGCAIDLDIVAAFNYNDSDVVRIRSENRRDIDIAVCDVDKKEHTSTGLVKGVIAYLKQQGFKVGGFDAYLHSILPSGVGVSSSAGFEMLIAQIVNHLFNDGKIDLESMIKAGQFAENEYYGKPSGMLDQSIVAVGGLVAMNFRNGFSYQTVESKVENLQYILINTGNSHSKLSNLYAQIPQDMKKIASFWGKNRLVDVDEKDFWNKLPVLNEKFPTGAVLRAKHFFEENDRVTQILTAFEKGDSCKVISLINASGESSKNQLKNCAINSGDTAISDCIAEAFSICPSCGARVHGGGFAGTVLCVVPRCQVDGFVEKMSERYGSENLIKMRRRNVGSVVFDESWLR